MATGEAEDLTMTEIATTATTEIGTDTETGARAANHQRDPAQLRMVVRLVDCATGDGGQTQGGSCVLAGATE